MSATFDTGTGCLSPGSGGWCVLSDDCVGTCQAPSVAFAASTAMSTSAQLREAQTAFAKSQADLTRVERERDRLRVINAGLMTDSQSIAKRLHLTRAELASALAELERLRNPNGGTGA